MNSKKYKYSKEMPESGQFIRIWTYNGKIWSDTMKIEDGRLFYDAGEEMYWVTESYSTDTLENVFYISLV